MVTQSTSLNAGGTPPNIPETFHGPIKLIVLFVIKKPNQMHSARNRQTIYKYSLNQCRH